MLTIEEVAKRLNGCEYGSEGSKELWKQCKAAGIVVVYGYSDDNVELEGAIRDEVGAYNGTTLHVSSAGLLVSKCSHGEDCPYYQMSLASASKIEATYSPWEFKTDIPHATFDVMEDGELYCRGIVFRLADAK
jgi:hypothetical protein